MGWKFFRSDGTEKVGGEVVTASSKNITTKTLIYDNTLGSAGQWDVIIPSGYMHLEILVEARGATAGSNVDSFLFKFNNDATAANYLRQYLLATSTTLSGASDTSNGLGNIPEANLTDDLGMVVMSIPLYAGSQHKQVDIRVLRLAGGADNRSDAYIEWQNTAAVTSMQFYTDGTGSNFATGSRIQIWGIKDEQVITAISNLSGQVAVDPTYANGRLTLESAVPVSTTDQTAKTTVYFTPYKGNILSLYDGSRWNGRTFSEISVVVPSTLFRPFDIFAYDNNGTVTLETVNWNQSSAVITGATNATPIVITSTGHGLSTGNVVGIAGIVGNTAPNGKLWTITVVDANSFSLDNSTGNGAYTSGGTWYKITNTRATALTLQDGVYVKSGATTRRYLGTGCTTGTSGQCEDSLTSRLLWNYYNRILRPVRVTESTDNWAYSTATFRPANNSTANRVITVHGLLESPLHLHAIGVFLHSASTVFGITGIGLDSTNTPLLASGGAVVGFADGSTSIAGNPFTIYDKVPPLGLHYYQWLEQASGTATQTWYGDNGGSQFQTGMNGMWEC